MTRLVLVLAISAAGLIGLGAGLRPDAFYAGDPGVKLIAARAALAHPLTPFEIPLPAIGADSVPSVEPFFSVHGGHRHAVTSPLFPALSAPLLAVFGVRGLYVLPGLGLLLAMAGCAGIATTLDSRRNEALTAAVAGLATPFIFYGLEFWEHMTSVGCASAALALCLRGRAIAGGLVLGLAVLLRPEAAWFGLAALIAAPRLPNPVGPRVWSTALAVLVIDMATNESDTRVHFGTLLPPHISANAEGLGGEWLASRAAIAWAWFLPGTNASIWHVAPLIVCGAGASIGLPFARDGRMFLWWLAVVDVLLVVASAPNDGGAQWGPRYLLFALVPLTVLAADAVQALPRHRLATGAVITIAVLGCAWVQRTGYRQLQGTKATYGRLADFVTAETVESSHIVTSLWWLDQVAAVAIGERQLFYAPEANTGRGLIRRLSDATVPVVTVASSASESVDPSAWHVGTCYFEERRRAIDTRDLVVVQLRHRCPP